jgi:hypothetical protein
MQYSCLTKLIRIRSEPTVSAQGPAMIDFEAFGQSIDADLSKTPWPPTGPTITRPHSPSILVNQNTASGLVNNNTQDLSTTAGGNLDLLEPDLGWGMGMGMGMGMNMGLDNQAEDDGFGWLSGLGAGEGFFGTDNANGNGNEGDLGFTQDPFWSVVSCSGSELADDQEINPGTCPPTTVMWTVRLLASCISCIAVIALL